MSGPYDPFVNPHPPGSQANRSFLSGYYGSVPSSHLDVPYLNGLQTAQRERESANSTYVSSDLGVGRGLVGLLLLVFGFVYLFLNPDNILASAAKRILNPPAPAFVKQCPSSPKTSPGDPDNHVAVKQAICNFIGDRFSDNVAFETFVIWQAPRSAGNGVLLATVTGYSATEYTLSIDPGRPAHVKMTNLRCNPPWCHR